MIQWNFYINDVQYDEPIGFSDIVLNISRNEQWHGIFFEASTSTFGFYGAAADALTEIKVANGLAATATLRIEAVCGETIDVLEGVLDFGTYIRQCGDTCIVNIGVEKSGCIMKMMNRYDQKVDLSKQTAFDNLTMIGDYPGLNFEMEIAGQDTEARVEGYVISNITDVQLVDDPDSDSFGMNIRPIYDREIYNSINDGELIPTNAFMQLPTTIIPDIPLSPQLLFNERLTCFPSPILNYEFRLKGRYSLNSNVTGFNAVAYFKTWNGAEGEDIFNNGDIIDSESVYGGGGSYTANTVFEFDVTFSGTITLVNGLGLYNFIQFSGFDSDDQNLTIHIEYDPETFVNIYGVRSCESTDAMVSIIHETGSRIVEAITERCLTLKSDYYGRTDSQPYAAAEDGCGSLRVLTSGLRLRNAENPVHFMSLRDFFMGLRAIDNIGMGVETDFLRVEPVEYFYQDVQIMQIDAIPSARFIQDSKYGYSVIKIGYTKWEVENFNGLDEFNSNKEFRTALSTIDQTLEAVSPFVSGGYPIEKTRQQSFADTGGADTGYDNDTFIICVERDAYGYHVEQGNIVDGANMYSPTTALNWRIRPYYNLMRWWKSISLVYTNLVNTTSKLFFSAGTGNLLATGELPVYDACKLEVGERPENDDLDLSDFAVTNLPIWKPERVTFTYPFSLKDYNTVTANQYGYINLQCGNGDYVKAFILSINYRPAQGLADFNLLLKWDIQY